MKHWLFGFMFALLVMISMFLSFSLAMIDECQVRGYNTAAIGSHGIYCINQNAMRLMERPLIEGDL